MRDILEPYFMRRSQQSPSRLERWSIPGRKESALQNHTGELDMHGIWFRAFNIPERLCFQMEWWWSIYSTSARQASHQRHAQTRWPQRAFPTSKQLKDCAPSELPTGPGTEYKSAFLKYFSLLLEELAAKLRRDQTRRLGRGAVGVVARRPAALGCSCTQKGTNAGAGLCLCGSCHAPLILFWWCLLSLTCGGSGSCSRNALTVGRCSKLNGCFNPKYAG